MIQSYSFKYRDNFSKPLSQNTPVNEVSPSWEEYRLSHSRMTHAFRDSQDKWSITCNYNTQGFAFADFVEVPVSSFNPFSKTGDGGKCIDVDNANIRGYKCLGCKVYVQQKHNRALHFRPHRSSNQCGFNITGLKQCGDGNWEQSFGFYRCYNSDHRCSSSPNSTTQMWFGSTL